MSSRARKELIAVEDTPYYHCISRCVRRAYLCGDAFQAQKNFDHRKLWLIERFKFLTSVFAIDVCVYAVMSNHYHLVLFINQVEEAGWSDEEVLERWGILFPTSTKKIKTLILLASSDVAKRAYQDKLQECRENLRAASGKGALKPGLA